MVLNKKKSVSSASKILKINISTAKMIVAKSLRMRNNDSSCEKEIKRDDNISQ